MKKALLIIGLLLTVTLVNSYNYPTRNVPGELWNYLNRVNNLTVKLCAGQII